MSIYDATNPTSMAARLAEYITDPSTIRVRVMEHYGRAPSVDQCRHLRQAALARRDEERKAMLQRTVDGKLGDLLGCGHPNTDDNVFFVGDRTACLICKGESLRKAQERWAARLKVRASELKVEPRREALDLSQIPNASTRVLSAAAHCFNVPLSALSGVSRDPVLVRARFAVAYVLREADPLKYSTPVLARIIGRKDHSTIIHAVKRARVLIEDDAEFAGHVATLRAAYAVVPGKVCAVLVDALVLAA